MSSRVKDEILLILEELGGEVVDHGGFAARKIFERISTTKTFTTVSTLLSELEREGLVVRDQPNLKRTTRIALNKPGVRPARKGLEVVMEQLSRQMASTVEDTVHAVLDAERVALEDEFASREVEASSELEDELRGEIANLRSQLADVKSDLAGARATIDQERANNDELRERVRIAEHNAQVWKNKRTSVPELYTQIKDRLSTQERRELEQLMKQTRS